MIKGIFCDFYGTVVHENGPISLEVIERVYRSGDAASPKEVVQAWYQAFDQRVQACCGPHYRTQQELALGSFQQVLERFHAKEVAAALCQRMVEHWCNPPLYEDAKVFLDQSSWPVYLVTSSDNLFVEQAVAGHGLKVSGITTSEDATYAKPHVELFEYALRRWGLSPAQVVHIGDSLQGDVRCPQALGIRTIWLNREDRPVPPDVTAAKDFYQVQAILQQWSEA